MLKIIPCFRNDYQNLFRKKHLINNPRNSIKNTYLCTKHYFLIPDIFSGSGYLELEQRLVQSQNIVV